MSLIIRPLEDSDLDAVKRFTDRAIGTGYFSFQELESALIRSKKNGISTSFVLVNPATKEIEGLRLSYPPGQWQSGKGGKLSPNLWKVSADDVGYFQSLFISPELTGHGWGQKLSKASIAEMKKLGAKAIVCHSWVESPEGSSGKYLLKLGFQPLTRYPHYWKNVDYQCTRCGKPCLCTAEEMILYL